VLGPLSERPALYGQYLYQADVEGRGNDASEYALSQVVQGYRCTEAKRIDENGESAEVPTKKGYKKTNLLPYLRNRHKH